MSVVHGHCAEKFQRVSDAFSANATDEVGACVAVYVDGRPVVDLWGGYADAVKSRAWEEDTICLFFSTTKGLMATCLHILADRGKLDLDAPVAAVWPEFAQAGKAGITVRHVLSYQTGLAALSKPLPAGAQYDWETMTRALAEQEPLWEPGTAFGYHLMTQGWLVGEILRRVDGRRPGVFFREEIAQPLGASVSIGVPSEALGRVAEILPPDPTQEPPDGVVGQILSAPDSLLARAVTNPPLASEPDAESPWNSRRWRQAEIPAANGHGNARGVARIYAALACGGTLDGVELLSPGAIERARALEIEGRDVVSGSDGRIALGYMLPDRAFPFSPNPRAFGHPGMGGAIGFADPEARLSFAYVMNRMGESVLALDRRARTLIDATYDCL